MHAVFALVFALGAGLAGLPGVVGGSALSVAPGEDVRYLLTSLVVVIVGGMGSITGAAIGALLIGLAEQIGLVYFPTYGVVLTFLIMVVTLAVRPQGIMGARHDDRRRDRPGRARRSARCRSICCWALALLLFPPVASDFFLTQIGAYSLIWGMLALSLMVLAGYGGMVSLAQITVAGVAGYAVAIFGENSSGLMGFGWPWWVVVPLAVALAAVASALIGWIAVRTEGIYTIMITLAIATAAYYFTQQNAELFNGHSRLLRPPRAGVLGHRLARPDAVLLPVPRAGGAVAYAAVLYGARITFGLTLQAIRDNPRRMRAHRL